MFITVTSNSQISKIERIGEELEIHWYSRQLLPPDGEFVAAMEDVLDVYYRPCDPEHPLVFMNEASK